MKDLYQIDRKFILKGKLKGLAEEIRTAKKQKQSLLRYARATKLKEGVAVQLHVDTFTGGTNAEKHAAKLAKKQFDASTREPVLSETAKQETRTLAIHLVEIAPSDEARHTLLAYMWLREKPYKLAEQTVREGNEASSAAIAHASFVGREYTAVQLAQRVEVIEAWLKVKAEPLSIEQPVATAAQVQTTLS